MTIRLTYTRVDGTQEQVEFANTTSTINLDGKQISQIDLSPLISNSRLKTLSLNNNVIKSIDLAPLSTCMNLKKVELRGNPLQFIERAFAGDNVEILYDNTVESYSWLHKKRSIYERPTSQYPWSFLYDIAAKSQSDYRLQQDILAAIGLKEYGFIDKDMHPIFSSFAPDTPINNVKESVRKTLLSKIHNTLEKGGPTTGLELGYFVHHHPEFAVRIHDIIKFRTAELKRVRIRTDKEEINLQDLWLTAYGYEILSALNMQITTNLEGLERIKVAMNDAGFELRTGRFPRSGVKMSDKLKNAIWWIANHRGEEWPLERFTQYLNGPMGKTVLDQLDEGESFILQTAEHTLKITKVKGRAVVTIP